MNELVDMRAPCSECGDTDGRVTNSNGQRVVRCAWCGTWCYNQPLAEAGLAPRKVSTRTGFKPSQRARILERDGWACVCCHRTDLPLHIGHLVSVADGARLGMADDEVNHDLNLAAMCEPCNLGLADRSVPPWLVFRAVRAALLREANHEAA